MDKHAIDALLGGAVAAGAAPGVVALAADRNGTIYEGAFGHRVSGGDAPMTLDTVLWIASMTKAVTSVAALQLVEAGRLKLDAPIAEVLPELGQMQVLEGHDADGTPRLRPARGAITLKHLLTHTAGFAYDIWNPDLGRYMEANGIPGIISCMDAALRVPLIFDPGARWEYGINIDHIGKAVERVTGRRLGDYFREHITGPLGMHDTAFRITPAMRARKAPIHVHNPDGGGLVATDIEITQEPEFEMGGGGLYSTLPDYLRFARMLLSGGTLDGVRILSPEMTAAALRNQTAPIAVGMLHTAMPAYSADAEFFPGLKKSWGLVGMVNDERAPTGRSPGAIAWAGLANTFWWVDAPRGMCAVFGTQVLPFGDPPIIDTLERYEAALLN
ncbi:serine hydrolase domain-containing protein [Acidisphaera rubrifaciens]|uniref:Beta-lactamase n=1 Tax=Acidisphaera rubrifaciens HS-AP3 TaxID=1231350 RepID=A0A0D6P9K1_9PROT|nr:serine hydrolase domain-containing protein [Acidisphaera rubrifaciens]GAN78440.1 beta-lactamase [Acidisphaera rubrifaciens HS-AP3]